MDQYFFIVGTGKQRRKCLVCSDFGNPVFIVKSKPEVNIICEKCNSPNYNLLVCRSCGIKKVLDPAYADSTNCQLLRLQKKLGIARAEMYFLPEHRGGITIIFPMCLECVPFISEDYLIANMTVISI